MYGIGLGRVLEKFVPGSIGFIDRAMAKPTLAPEMAVIPEPPAPLQSSPSPATSLSPENYWSEHNVTEHYAFKDAADSLDYFHWRNDQYFGYIDLLPVSDVSGLTVVDFGCGPGHDLVGFGVYSKPGSLIGVDVSRPSVDEARYRLALHSISCEIIHQPSTDTPLPLADGSVDLVHSSGVLHHTPNLDVVLREFHRVLKPGGRARIMVYNQNSLFLHLYVAYQKMIVEEAYPGLSLHEAFQKSTDGPNCPISRCYTPGKFLELTRKSGFKGRFLGAAISVSEMSLLPKRFDAIQDRRLPAVSRSFLTKLEFTNRGFPTWNGMVAGVDACFELTRE